ncbi:U3 small nucleolar RNA-associated protein 6-domain-containing protein [Phycomyces blakesleeanus]|uniref:U3 small nucleolar RNA-associated protein 6-domain-containing protein n=1 Tax=Phycomyces blakesleeanus TaxID=4837 RepID=A0ABR3BAJ6_PHYBL
MAERVQFNLERMVPALMDLINRGLFTKEEVKKIVEKRKSFESRISRRIPQKIDYLRYIEYEMSLDSLRKLRKARLAGENAKTISESDYAGNKRIFELFKRATNKFKGDVRLWIQYIDFAKKVKANNILSGIFVQAIQFHPTKATLWILAASWEYETNANIGAARVLMQRALRINPENKLLWHEYFRLELLYVEKIKIRRRILGIDEKSIEKEEAMEVDEEKTEDDGNVIRLPTITGEMVQDWNNESKERKTVDTLEKSSANALKEGINPILRGLLAKIVYNNAIQAIPNDLEFRAGFVNIYRIFTDVEEGCKHVFDTIMRDMATSPKARAYLAERHLFETTVDNTQTGSEKAEESEESKYISVSDPRFVTAIRACVADFEVAVEELTSPEMWMLYVEFLTNWKETVSEENLKLYLTKLLQKTFKACQKKGLVSEKVYEIWIKQLQSENNNLQAQEVAKKAVKAFPQNANLWTYRIDLAQVEGGKDESQQALYKKALEKNPASYTMWSSYNDWIMRQWELKTFSTEETNQIYTDAGFTITQLLPSVTLSTNDRNKIKDLIMSSHVKWASRASGIEGARATYKSIIKNMYPTFAFFKTCLAIEEEESKEHDTSSEAEQLYDMATRMDGDKEDIYLSYIAYLRSQKKFDKANHIYKKAIKEVPDREKFDVLCSV